jgi:DNA modification methylase
VKIIEYINKIFQEDNLELMKKLPNESIDLIYCDILYNTGKKFDDYNDNLGTPEQAMEWYKPRLQEMKRILNFTGSIYLQCDYRLIHYLKIEMDKVFGINNFRNEIIWHYKSMSNTKRYYPRKHDSILFYTKSDTYTFNYDNDSVQVPYSEATIKRSKTKAGFNNDKADYLKSNTYLIEDVWDDISFLKNGVMYNTQKPKPLLERIIKTSTNEDDVVADFFMGSGTTCVVAKELSRKYLGCDIGEKAVKVSEERIKSA